MIDIYNKYMGGTDVGDRQRSYLDLEGPQIFRKWYKKAYFGTLGCMIVNASVYYGKMVQTDSWKDRGLLLRYANALQKRLVHMNGSKPMKVVWKLEEKIPEPEPAAATSTPSSNRATTRRMSVSPIDQFADSVSPQVSPGQPASVSVHMPVPIGEGNVQRECVYCKVFVSPSKFKNPDRFPRTRQKCSVCDAPLCHGGERNCFALYHANEAIQKEVKKSTQVQRTAWKRKPKDEREVE
jgi:hypothetical protein